MEKIGSLLSEQLRAEWRWSLEEICGRDGVMVEDVRSMFTFGPLHNFPLEMSRLLKFRLTQCLSSDGNYSPFRGLVWKKNGRGRYGFRYLKRAMVYELTVKRGTQFLDFNVDFAMKEQNAQLNALLARERLQTMMKGRTYRAVDAALPFVPAFSDTSLSFRERGDFVQKNAVSTGMVDRVLFELKGGPWVYGERLKTAVRYLKGQECC